MISQMQLPTTDPIRAVSPNNIPDFETFWKSLATWLKKKRHIRKWSVCRSYFGNDFDAWYSPERDLVRVEDIRVRKKSIQAVYEGWEQYLARKITRSQLCGKDFFSSYTISIIKEYFDSHQNG